MSNRSRRVIKGAFVLLSLACPAAASAAPVTVNLRVEGATSTIFEGPVVTDVHPVTTPADGQPRTCDGSSVGAPSGPTAIGALDDGARANGFAWDARWDSSFSDYYPFLRVGPDSIDSSSHYLALFVNWAFAEVGGCGQRVAQADDVVFAYEDFASSPLLRLSGPATATTGESVSFRAVDGLDGSPQAGATVAGATTGADGVATVSFADEGIYRVKAERPGAIRSNAVVLCVDPAGAIPCSSTDREAPSLQTPFGAGDPRLPGRVLASTVSRSRTLLVSWAAQDGAGSGVAHSSVEVSEVHTGAAASQAEWRPLVDKAPVSGVHFRGERGSAYRFRISATDRALNTATVVTDPVLMPVDDRDRRLLRLSRAWKRVRVPEAWGRTVVRASRPGATARLRFDGTQVALIGRRLARGGRLQVTVDGESSVVRTRGRSAQRSVLWVSRRLEAGSHSLRLRSLGGGPVELDAVAPSP